MPKTPEHEDKKSNSKQEEPSSAHIEETPQERARRASFESSLQAQEQEIKAHHATQAATSSPTGQRNKQGIALLISLIVVYTLYKIFFSHSPTASLQSASSSKPLKKSVVPTVPMTKQEQKTPMSVPGLQDTRKTLEQQIFELRQQKTDDQNDMRELQEEVQHLHTQMARLESNIKETTQLMHATSKQVMLLQTLEHKKAMSIQKKKKKQGTETPSHPWVKYYVRAIVPGRAWIYTHDGLVRTVKVGDRVGDYGVIQRINPALGLVKAQHGIITFGHNDS